MNEHPYDSLKRPMAIVLLVWSAFCMVCVMGVRYSPPLIRSLVPYGMIFGIISLIMLAGYCLFFNVKKSIGWIIAVWVLVTPFYFFGFILLHASSLKGGARIILGNSVFSLFIVGVMVLRGKW